MKLRVLLAVILSVAVMSVPVCAHDSTFSVDAKGIDRYNWYCKNNNSQTPPELPSEFFFIKENGGYYLDERATEERKIIYLTFDAGYENGNIEKILDVLKAHDAPAAFFVLGNLIVRNTALVKRMIDEGHLVCNHTNRHHDMSKITDEKAFCDELESLNTIMKNTCGCELAPFYRPPEGKFSEDNLRWAKENGYQTIFWSYAYADWDNKNQMSEEKALNKLLTHTHNGEVLLLHPTSATNAAILDAYLTKLEADGYTFGTLYELTAER